MIQRAVIFEFRISVCEQVTFRRETEGERDRELCSLSAHFYAIAVKRYTL